MSRFYFHRYTRSFFLFTANTLTRRNRDHDDDDENFVEMFVIFFSHQHHRYYFESYFFLQQNYDCVRKAVRFNLYVK
jgi:hypothetical protein